MTGRSNGNPSKQGRCGLQNIEANRKIIQQVIPGPGNDGNCQLRSRFPAEQHPDDDCEARNPYLYVIPQKNRGLSNGRGSITLKSRAADHLRASVGPELGAVTDAHERLQVWSYSDMSCESHDASHEKSLCSADGVCRTLRSSLEGIDEFKTCVLWAC